MNLRYYGFQPEIKEYVDNTLRPGVYKTELPYIISFIGEANVSKDGLCDLADIHGSEAFIEGNMLHFIAEFPDNISPHEMVLYQRRFITIVKQKIEGLGDIKLTQGGDDLYYKGRKLSVSIVAPSTVGTYLMHAAFNITNKCKLNISWLDEFIDTDYESLVNLSLDLMGQFKNELDSINYAVHKVKPIYPDGHFLNLEKAIENASFRVSNLQKIIRDLYKEVTSTLPYEEKKDKALELISLFPLNKTEELKEALSCCNDDRHLVAFAEALIIKLLRESKIVSNY